jgi:Serine dehydrogenase proteinase
VSNSLSTKPAASNPYEARQGIYKKIERQRRSRVIAYVTGDRQGMQTQIANDSVDLFEDHLDAIFPTKKISLILYTMGGNTMAAWNLVGMLRMFCDELEIIVPARARSAGTLMCLGADRVLMTKQATLGPIDPSLAGPLNPQIPGAAPDARAPVSVEAVRGYIEMAKQDFGVKGSTEMAEVLNQLSNKVHPLVLGSIFRSRSQIQALARELLKSQVKDATKTKKIIDFLCSESGSHDYTINRREAKQLGLTVENPSQDFYDLLKSWMATIREELELAAPFEPNAILGNNPSATYSCVRCLIESTASAGQMFVSEGELKRVQVNNPMVGQQDAINDTRLFEGWRTRSSETQ